MNSAISTTCRTGQHLARPKSHPKSHPGGLQPTHLIRGENRVHRSTILKAETRVPACAGTAFRVHDEAGPDPDKIPSGNPGAVQLLKLGVYQNGDTLVCAGSDGSVMLPTSLTHEFAKIAGWVEGVPRVRFHDLRHSQLPQSSTALSDLL